MKTVVRHGQGRFILTAPPTAAAAPSTPRTTCHPYRRRRWPLHLQLRRLGLQQGQPSDPNFHRTSAPASDSRQLFRMTSRFWHRIRQEERPDPPVDAGNLKGTVWTVTCNTTPTANCSPPGEKLISTTFTQPGWQLQQSGVSSDHIEELDAFMAFNEFSNTTGDAEVQFQHKPSPPRRRHTAAQWRYRSMIRHEWRHCCRPRISVAWRRRNTGQPDVNHPVSAQGRNG